MAACDCEKETADFHTYDISKWNLRDSVKHSMTCTAAVTIELCESYRECGCCGH